MEKNKTTTIDQQLDGLQLVAQQQEADATDVITAIRRGASLLSQRAANGHPHEVSDLIECITNELKDPHLV
jgi:hypothetical protein